MECGESSPLCFIRKKSGDDSPHSIRFAISVTAIVSNPVHPIDNRSRSPCAAHGHVRREIMSNLSDRKMSKRRFVSRRDFLFDAGTGISGLALIDLLGQEGLLAQEPSRPALACAGREGFPGSPNLPKPPHFKPRAKSVISLFMSGGVSHVDTFDYKPALEKYHGMPLEGKGEIRVRQGFPGPLMKSPYRFKQYGQSGAWVSELFPHIANIVDD